MSEREDQVHLQQELSHVYDIHTGHNLHPPAPEEEFGNVRLSPAILQFLQGIGEVKFCSY